MHAGESGTRSREREFTDNERFLSLRERISMTTEEPLEQKIWKNMKESSCQKR